MKKHNRSNSYQNLFAEISTSLEFLESFSNEDGVYKRLNPFDYDDRIAELEEELRIEFWRVVRTQLTKRQREVVELYSKGLTQQEIAKKLKINQSSITKSINGNAQYFNKSKNKPKTYGGIKKRFKTIIEEDEKIKEILKKIKAIREEKW